MRRKKNLDERVEACCDLLLQIDIKSFNLNEKDLHIGKFNCEEIFKNSNPVHLEIGCGKGQFVIEMAKRHPEINFIAVEKTENVIVTALENADKEKLDNLRFINCGAEYLENYFEDKSIDRIYLNFSCPYPKKKYAKHRLTSESYLKIYKKILKPKSEIHLKTDNTGFFEFTINSMSGFGFVLKNVTFDLHKSGFEGNIITEYEQRFANMGCSIYRLEAYLN